MHPIYQLQGIYFFTGLFSLLASAFVLIGFLVVPRVRETMVMQILSIVAICSIGLSLKYFIPSATNQLGREGSSCHILAFVGQFFITAIVCWYGTLFINSVRALYGRDMENTKNTMLLSHVVIWIYSFITSILCLELKQYGMTEDGTCWIAGGQNPFRLFFFIPLLITMLVSIVLIITLFKRMIHNARIGAENTLPRGARRRVVTFLVVFIVTWLWLFLIGLFEAWHSKTPNVLLILNAVALPGQGTTNFCLWVSSPLLFPEFIFKNISTRRQNVTQSSFTSSQQTHTRHESDSFRQENIPSGTSSVPFRGSPLRDSLIYHSKPSSWSPHRIKQNTSVIVSDS